MLVRAVLSGRCMAAHWLCHSVHVTAAGASTPLRSMRTCLLGLVVSAWPLMDCMFLRLHTAGSNTCIQVIHHLRGKDPAVVACLTTLYCMIAGDFISVNTRRSV